MWRQAWILSVALALQGMMASTAVASDHWSLALPGMSHHFEKPRQRGFEWNQYHDGLGLKRTIDLRRDPVHAGWVLQQSGGVMLDSFGNPSAYAGAALAWRERSGGFVIDSALAPMLLYRTTRFNHPVDGAAPMRLIPVVLPTISVEHRGSGTGANIIAVPGMNLGSEFRMPGLVFVQLTRPLR